LFNEKIWQNVGSILAILIAIYSL